jgi:hypothetical protein
MGKFRLVTADGMRGPAPGNRLRGGIFVLNRLTVNLRRDPVSLDLVREHLLFRDGG